MIFTSILLLITSILIIKNNYKALLFIILFSTLNDLCQVSIFGVSIELAQLLALGIVPVIMKNTKLNEVWYTLRPLKYELLWLMILVVLFGFISPWQDPYAYTRSWSQQSQGRSIVASISILSELMIAVLIYYLMAMGKIQYGDILKILGLVVVISLFIAIYDYFTNYSLKNLLFESSRVINGRFTGLNGEPRAFGRSMAMAFLLFYVGRVNKQRVKFLNIYSLLSFISVIISFSTSSFFVLITSILILSIIKYDKKTLIITVCISGISIFIYYTTASFEYIEKVNKIYEGELDDQMYQEPFIFTRFEVFDRAALNYLYENPIYCIIGTGPNLISIPASNYISPKAKAIYKDRIDSVPHTGVINILARSGLFGIIVFSYFFSNIYRKNIKYNNVIGKDLIIILSAFFILINISLVYVVIGILLSTFKSSLNA